MFCAIRNHNFKVGHKPVWGMRVEKSSLWALAFKYSRQFKEKEGPNTFCHFCSEALGGGSQQLYYHDCSGTTSQVTPQGCHP